jgi:hypothetical protein
MGFHSSLHQFRLTLICELTWDHEMFIHVLFMDIFICFQLDLLFCLGVWILQARQLFHKKESLEKSINYLVYLI